MINFLNQSIALIFPFLMAELIFYYKISWIVDIIPIIVTAFCMIYDIESYIAPNWKKPIQM